MSKAAELAALIGSQTALSNRNIVINGAMQVAQRATSVADLGTSHNTYHTVDRFKVLTGADATAGRFTMSQSSVTNLARFSNAIRLDCTTADTSIAAGEACVLTTSFEGQDLQRLLNTSTSTKAFTISFYARANESRAVVLEARTSHGTNRQIAKVFTITSSWQRFEFNVPSSASGMEFGDDNTEDLQLNWWQHAGSTYAGGTLSTDWAGDTAANRAAGVGSLFASTSNFFEITGIQLEVGEQATAFEHRSFGDELARCQRYFIKLGGGTDAGAFTRISVSQNESATRNTGAVTLPVQMRAEPTLVADGNFAVFANAIVTATNAISINSVGSDNGTVCLIFDVAGGLTAGQGAVQMGSSDTTANIKLDAEL